MSDVIKGETLTAFGKIERGAGEVVDRPDLQATGAAKEFKGRVQSATDKLKDKALDMSGTVSAAAAKATDQAKDLYAQAAEQYEIAASQIDPFVRERPYAAVGMAAAAGLLAGLLWAGRGPKVVYLKPPRA